MLDQGVMGGEAGVGRGAALTAGFHRAHRISAIIDGVLLVVAGGIPTVGAASERHRGQPSVDTNHASPNRISQCADAPA